MKHPLNAIDQILADYASPRTRRLIHFALALGLLVLSAVLAADGDWKKALISLAATLYAAVNKANTPALTHVDLQQDDAETYEEAGGRLFPDNGGFSGDDVNLYSRGGRAQEDPGIALS